MEKIKKLLSGVLAAAMLMGTALCAPVFAESGSGESQTGTEDGAALAAAAFSPAKVAKTASVKTGTGSDITITTASVFPLASTVNVYFEVSGLPESGSWFVVVTPPSGSASSSRSMSRLGSVYMFSYSVSAAAAGSAAFTVSVQNSNDSANATVVYDAVTLTTSYAAVDNAAVLNSAKDYSTADLSPYITFYLPFGSTTAIGLMLTDSSANPVGAFTGVTTSSSVYAKISDAYAGIFSNYSSYYIFAQAAAVRGTLHVFNTLAAGRYNLVATLTDASSVSAPGCFIATADPVIEYMNVQYDSASNKIRCKVQFAGVGWDVGAIVPKLTDSSGSAVSAAVAVVPDNISSGQCTASYELTPASALTGSHYTVTLTSTEYTGLHGSTQTGLYVSSGSTFSDVTAQCTGPYADMLVYCPDAASGTPYTLTLSSGYGDTAEEVASLIAEPANGLFDVEFLDANNAPIELSRQGYQVKISSVDYSGTAYFYAIDAPVQDTAVSAYAYFSGGDINASVSVPNGAADPIGSANAGKLSLVVTNIGYPAQTKTYTGFVYRSYYSSSAAAKAGTPSGNMYRLETPCALPDGSYKISLRYNGSTLENSSGTAYVSETQIREKLTGVVIYTSTTAEQAKKDGKAAYYSGFCALDFAAAPASGAPIVLYLYPGDAGHMTGTPAKISFTGNGKDTFFAPTAAQLKAAGVDLTKRYFAAASLNGKILVGDGSELRFVWPDDYTESSATYTAAAETPEHGTLTLDCASGEPYALVHAIAVPDTGYQLKAIKVNGQEIVGREFRLMANSVVTAEFELLPGYKIDYEYAPSSITGPAEAPAGSVVTLTIADTETQTLKSLYEVDGDAIPFTLGADGKTATFTMPARNIQLEADFGTLCAVTLNVTAGSGHGAAALPEGNFFAGEQVHLVLTPDPGYYAVVTAAVDSGTPNVYQNIVTPPAAAATCAVSVQFLPLTENMFNVFSISKTIYSADDKTVALTMNVTPYITANAVDQPVYAAIYDGNGKLAASTPGTLLYSSTEDQNTLSLSIPLAGALAAGTYTVKVIPTGLGSKPIMDAVAGTFTVN